MNSVYVLRRNWALPAVGLVVLLAGVAGIAAGFPVAGFAVWMGMFFTPATLFRSSFPFSNEGMLEIVGEELQLFENGSTRRLAIDDIISVKLVPRRGPVADTMIVIESRSSKRMWLWMRFPEAKALSERIGRRRASFPLIPRLLSRFLFGFVVLGTPQVILGILSFSPIAAVMGIIASAVQALLLAWLLGHIRGSVTIGIDGISIRWPLRRRFLRFDDIASIGRSGLVTLVTTKGGRVFRLQAREIPTTQAEVGAESAALNAAITEAFDKHRGRETGEGMLRSLVARGGQTAKQWLGTLDRIARGGAMDYRMRAVDKTMLRVLADDASEELDTRVGAAAALVRLDPTNRTAIRIAAEASADVEARERLLRVSEAEDDISLEIALERKIGSRS